MDAKLKIAAFIETLTSVDTFPAERLMTVAEWNFNEDEMAHMSRDIGEKFVRTPAPAWLPADKGKKAEMLKGLYARGFVGVTTKSGRMPEVHFRFRSKTGGYRGSALSDSKCTYDDSFVRTLARDWRASL